MLREDLMKSRQAERLAKQKLVEMTSSPDLFSVSAKLLDAFQHNGRRENCYCISLFEFFKMRKSLQKNNFVGYTQLLVNPVVYIVGHINTDTNIVNEHNMVKNPNWQEADQLAVLQA